MKKKQSIAIDEITLQTTYDKHKSYVLSRIKEKYHLNDNEAMSYYDMLQLEPIVQSAAKADCGCHSLDHFSLKKLYNCITSLS